MNLLAIETATDAVGVAVAREGGAAERLHLGGRQHAERLAPLVEEALATSGCPLPALVAVAVDVGPGLFTGLRVGVATAKALAQACGVGVLPVTSLDVLAAAAAGAAAAEELARVATVVPVVDARRGEVFAAAYRLPTAASGERRPAPGHDGRAGPDGHDGRAGRDDPPVIDVAPPFEDRPGPLPPDELAAWLGTLASGPVSVLVVGDGALRYLGRLAEDPGLDLAHAAALATPPPSVLARLAVGRLAAGAVALPPEEVVPDYRRAADARIHWERRSERPPPPARRPPTAPAAERSAGR